MSNKKKSDELLLAYKELAFQKEEGVKRTEELILANIELDFQNIEKGKRAAELTIANQERDFQNGEKEKRAAELTIANIERDFQNIEKEKRAAELTIANNELLIQNQEKEKRATELIAANKELIFQNEEKEKRAAELIIANKELVFQNEEKEKRAAELAIANKELAFQNQLKELNEKKDEFIALASHELKTPLTSINAYLQFLQRNLINDEKNKQLTVKALYQVEKLSGLIADLLDVSKIESGKLALSLRTFDSLELLKEVIEMMQYGNLTHKIKIDCKFEQLYVYADKQRIEQVIINLISNAVKYSPNADRVVVTISETDDDAIISVRDFGIGIKEDQQAHIFSRFYRVAEVTPFISGLGIGLYISDDIISRHNSKLCVESKFGAGSKFYFKLSKSKAFTQISALD